MSCEVAVGGCARAVIRRDCILGGGWQRLERRLAGHCGPDEAQRFCRRRNTRMMGCWVAGSCGVLVERQGAKQELSRGEACDDMHGPASSTLDAPPPDSLPSMPPSISQARQTWHARNRELQLLTNIYFPLLNLYDLRVRNGYLYLRSNLTSLGQRELKECIKMGQDWEEVLPGGRFRNGSP
jgi:hypothetical protein